MAIRTGAGELSCDRHPHARRLVAPLAERPVHCGSGAADKCAPACSAQRPCATKASVGGRAVCAQSCESLNAAAIAPSAANKRNFANKIAKQSFVAQVCAAKQNLTANIPKLIPNLHNHEDSGLKLCLGGLPNLWQPRGATPGRGGRRCLHPDARMMPSRQASEHDKESDGIGTCQISQTDINKAGNKPRQTTLTMTTGAQTIGRLIPTPGQGRAPPTRPTQTCVESPSL